MDRLTVGDDTALGQQFFNIAQDRLELEITPNCLTDEVARACGRDKAVLVFHYAVVRDTPCVNLTEHLQEMTRSLTKPAVVPRHRTANITQELCAKGAVSPTFTRFITTIVLNHFTSLFS